MITQRTSHRGREATRQQERLGKLVEDGRTAGHRMGYDSSRQSVFFGPPCAA
ncbi:MAG: hypothetical protein KDB05_29240 [Planctomycetales bacterium]|nr:hypothetical protein [Planctomycetales bacterium]